MESRQTYADQRNENLAASSDSAKDLSDWGPKNLFRRPPGERLCGSGVPSDAKLIANCNGRRCELMEDINVRSSTPL